MIKRVNKKNGRIMVVVSETIKQSIKFYEDCIRYLNSFYITRFRLALCYRVKDYTDGESDDEDAANMFVVAKETTDDIMDSFKELINVHSNSASFVDILLQFKEKLDEYKRNELYPKSKK